MRFKEDLVCDFVNYKLNNPQALAEEMRLVEDRKECIAKLDQYSRQMDILKNQHHSYQQILEALISKRTYIQQTFKEQKVEHDLYIVKCKEKIESNSKEAKQRVSMNQYVKKEYEQFYKEIEMKKLEFVTNFAEERAQLIYDKTNLKKTNQQKQIKKAALDELLRKLKDREVIIKNTLQNLSSIRNKWQTRQSQLATAKQEYQKRQKQIKQQMSYSNSMQKVIYTNFYKRCSQVVGEMKEGLYRMFDVDYGKLLSMSWEERLEKLLTQLKVNRQNLNNFIIEKREKYRIGGPLPEPDAEIYNNIVETKINEEMLSKINQEDYQPNTDMLKDIEEGQSSLMEKLEIQLLELDQKELLKDRQITDLQKRVKEFEQQIQNLKKTLLSPKKGGKKT